jgi:mono/diheme cytochrome c family protein
MNLMPRTPIRNKGRSKIHLKVTMKILVRGLVGLLAIGVCGVAGTFAFIHSGVYNVTATAPHTRLVAWALHQTYRYSMKRDAADIKVPADLETAANIQAGVQLYARNCAMCHGAPGLTPSPLRQGIYPSAPFLLAATRKNAPNESFWVIKNGVKMTGMAAFGKSMTDQQIWDLAAFLHKDRGISAADYAKLAAN